MNSQHNVVTIMPATHCTKVSSKKLQKSMSRLAAKHFNSNCKEARTLVIETTRMARDSLPIRSRRKSTGFTPIGEVMKTNISTTEMTDTATSM